MHPDLYLDEDDLCGAILDGINKLQNELLEPTKIIIPCKYEHYFHRITVMKDALYDPNAVNQLFGYALEFCDYLPDNINYIIESQ